MTRSPPAAKPRLKSLPRPPALGLLRLMEPRAGGSVELRPGWDGALSRPGGCNLFPAPASNRCWKMTHFLVAACGSTGYNRNKSRL